MKVNVELELHELFDLDLSVMRGKFYSEIVAKMRKDRGDLIGEEVHLNDAKKADELHEKLETILQEAINTMRKGEA